MKPFVALGSPAQTLLGGSVGLRPLGVVVGVSVVGNAAMNLGGLDGSEIRYRAESFGLALGNARRRAVEQAAALGASGVVGVRIETRNLGEPGNPDAMVEVRCVGTAVLGGVPAVTPFLSSLDGPGLVTLAAAGYRPVGLAVGYAFFAQIPGYRTTNAQGTRGTWGFKPYEHPDYTRATLQARAIAMGRLQADAREAGGDGVVGVEFRPEIVKRAEGMRIDVVAVGSAVRRDHGHGASEPPRKVVPLRQRNVNGIRPLGA